MRCPIWWSRRSRRWLRPRCRARPRRPIRDFRQALRKPTRAAVSRPVFVNFLIKTAACWPSAKPSRKRSGNMGTQSIDAEHAGDDDANRRLVRFFSICLGSLALVYSLLSLRLFLEHGTFQIADFALTLLRVSLGAAALLIIFYPPWLARPLERQIDLMGRL